MSRNPNVITIIAPNVVDIKGFAVSTAVKVSASGISKGTVIAFKRVDYSSSQPQYNRSSCRLITPTKSEVSGAMYYKIGECEPTINPNRNSIIIPYAGNYIPVVEGDRADLKIDVEPVELRQFNEKELGVDPCGYSPSIPLHIQLDECESCGSTVRGFIFHPDELRDPEATVEIRDCNKLIGYAYPTAGKGHTLPIAECDGTVVGYASNYSETAPQAVSC